MKRIFALTAALLGAALAGPADNSLVIGTSQEPPNIYDPWSTNNLAITAEINNWLGDGLIYPDNNGKVVAGIASKVPTSKNGGYKEVKKNGKIISNSLTFDINPKAKWSDGKPITVKDVQFWFKVQNDETTPAASRDPWDRATIKKHSDKKFTITFKPPFLFANTHAGSPSIAPSHIMESKWNSFKKSVKGKKGEAANEAWKKFISQFTTSKGLPKVVSGPFKVKSWSAGSSLVLERNKNHWRTPTGGADKYLQKVTYRFIPDTNTLKINMLSGQLDALSSIGIDFSQAIDLAKNKKFDTFFVPGAIWEHIDVNTRSPQGKKLGLDDKRVRQALLYAIDREKLVQALFNGKQPVSHSWVSTLADVYKKNLTPYKYNPEKAKKLLAAAGWKAGKGGILEKDGQKFKIRFSTTASNKVRERVQQILQAQWKKVGIQVDIQNYPPSVYFGPDFLPKGEEGKWDLAMYAWISDPTREEGNLFKGEAIPNKDNGFSGQNNSGWENAKYDKAQLAAQTEFNTAKRAKLFDTMQTVWAKEVPSIPLYNRSNPYSRAKGLVNYTFSAVTQYPTWDAYHIGWSKKGAKEFHKQK